ncbi:MAG TPA: hypothetical protein VGB24_22920 [Longimicrobium sp.]|jgi:hypothetical protein|uniref:hypothetical protein n=1 Tax=Longimicrobium sp. TaxID=2029185 RepID=UPI002EDA7BC5
MRRNLYAALAAIVLTACGDPSGSGDQQGLLRFNYTGALTGSYVAEAPAQDTSGTGPYALARPHLVGYEIESRSASPMVRVGMITDQRATGVYEVQLICDISDTRRCAAGAIEFPADPATGVRQRYVMVAGTVTITSANARRIRGTFSGTAELNVARQIQVQNGEFDLPVLGP